ncbi:MAG: LapA family protein [Chloroflexaceae bacterium]|jgi:uncharacterized integral membrane protein|nr:LapA family protein [Chloroflexaceae bacterium]
MQTITRTLAFVFMVALALLLVTFGVLNTTTVEVNLFFYQFSDLPLSLVVVGSAVIGALIVGLFTTWTGIQRSLQMRKVTKEKTKFENSAIELKKKVDDLEREVAVLRGKPMTPEHGVKKG